MLLYFDMFVSRNVDIYHVFCNDYIRIKQPLASIILITNSRFNSTNHKLDTMNAEQPGNWECFIIFICAIVNLSKFSHISLMYMGNFYEYFDRTAAHKISGKYCFSFEAWSRNYQYSKIKIDGIVEIWLEKFDSLDVTACFYISTLCDLFQ